MTINWTVLLANAGLFILVGFVVYVTKSPWGLLGLIFVFSSSTSRIETQCPKCDYEFTAVRKEEDD